MTRGQIAAANDLLFPVGESFIKLHDLSGHTFDGHHRLLDKLRVKRKTREENRDNTGRTHEGVLDPVPGESFQDPGNAIDGVNHQGDGRRGTDGINSENDHCLPDVGGIQRIFIHDSDRGTGDDHIDKTDAEQGQTGQFGA